MQSVQQVQFLQSTVHLHVLQLLQLEQLSEQLQFTHEQQPEHVFFLVLERFAEKRFLEEERFAEKDI